ncbi:MAG TPA: hypothetical protein VK112_12040, partial [Fodinibius sp.]|nr:hypothetical protein [Fodinibius sp.]
FRDENSPMVQAGVADVNLDSYFPKPYFNSGKNKQTQTRYLQDASYMRLKNLQLGYTFTDKIMSAIGARSLRLYVSGENLLTFTSLVDTFDPEDLALEGWDDGKTYPLSRVYSVGLDIRF